MKKTFFIQNMVCDRCIKVLRDELSAISVKVEDIKLGKIDVEFTSEKETDIIRVVQENGFVIINELNARQVEMVKLVLLELLRNLPVVLEGKLSEYIAEELNMPYYKISRIFSVTTKTTIEKYFIKLKVEKVKELMQQHDYNFTEISQLLSYSNVNHLSRQFKTETGLSLSDYKTQNANFRNPLDKII